MVTVDIHTASSVHTVMVNHDVCLTEILSHKDIHGEALAIYAYMDTRDLDGDVGEDGWVWDPIFSDNWGEVSS